MSGEVEKQGGRWVRPRFAYDDTLAYENCATQLLESIRNVLEDIKSSQMLQCDVRQDIREIRLAVQRKRRKPKAKAKRRRP